MADPITDFVTSSIELAQTSNAGAIISLGLGAWLVYTLWVRFRTGSDPSARKWSSSALGASSFLISGVYLTATVCLVIAILTWPMVTTSPFLALALVAAVVLHAMMEYRESRGVEADA